jgi:hypothetical protein
MMGCHHVDCWVVYVPVEVNCVLWTVCKMVAMEESKTLLSLIRKLSVSMFLMMTRNDAPWIYMHHGPNMTLRFGTLAP